MFDLGKMQVSTMGLVMIYKFYLNGVLGNSVASGHVNRSPGPTETPLLPNPLLNFTCVAKQSQFNGCSRNSILGKNPQLQGMFVREQLFHF